MYETQEECASVKNVWYPMLIQCKCYYHMRLMTFLLHMVPAYLADAVLMCKGQERTMVKLYSTIQNVIEKLGYFAKKSYLFKSENIGRMLSNMSPRDREIFFCDMRALSWDDFFITYFKGIRVYLFRDPLDTLKEGRIKAKR
nr:unnamed protein product [Callosobruchus chinensis]